MPDTISDIRAMLDDFKRAERRVADCILRDPIKILSYNITDLSDKSGVSEPTVVRFCRKLGLKGYMELRLNLARDLPPPTYVHQTITDDDNPVKITEKIINTHRQGLKDALQQIDFRDFERAVAMLSAAQKIDFYGFGGSGIVAKDAYHKFFRLGIPCSTYKDANMHLIGASLLNTESVAVGLSINGSNFDIIESVRIAKEAGAKTIAVIGFQNSPLNKHCDLVFAFPCLESVPQTYSLTTRMAQLAFLDALFIAVIQQKGLVENTSYDKVFRTMLNKHF